MSNKIQMVAGWLSQFIILNVLWFVFTVLGLGILGFMPATVAVFSVSRDLINRKEGVSIPVYFFRYYKKTFLLSNGFGFLFAILGYIGYVNFRFIPFFYPDNIQVYLMGIFIAGAVVLTLTFINLFSVMAHYDLKGFQYVKNAFSLVFAEPGLMLMQLFWIVAYAFILIFLPKVSIFIGVSMFIYLIMSIHLSRFERIKRKTEAKAMLVNA